MVDSNNIEVQLKIAIIIDQTTWMGIPSYKKVAGPVHQPEYNTPHIGETPNLF